MLLPHHRRREPAQEFSAANQSSIADRRPARLDRGNADPSGQEVRVRLRVARGPSIQHALLQADSRRVDRQVLAPGLALARVPALVHALASAHDLAPAALHHRRKRRARNAPLRAAAAVVSSSTRRPKKAR